MQAKSKNELAVSLFKALSIYAFIQAVAIIAERFPYPYWTGSYENKLLVAIEASASALLLVIFGIIIWMRSDALASTISRTYNDNGQTAASSNDIHVIAFSSVGIYFLCESIPNIARLIVFYYQLHAASFRGLPGITSDPGFLAEKYATLVYSIIQLVIGLWLLFGSRGIVKLIQKTRGNHS